MPEARADRIVQTLHVTEGLLTAEKPGGGHERVSKSLVYAIVSGRFV